MRLTTRSRYALIAIADIALRGSQGPIALSTIGERHGISLSYLEMLFSALRRAGLVDSTRGPGVDIHWLAARETSPSPTSHWPRSRAKMGSLLPITTK